MTDIESIARALPIPGGDMTGEQIETCGGRNIHGMYRKWEKAQLKRKFECHI